MKDNITTSTAALVVAAGRGQRFGGDLPKQYTLFGKKPIIFHTVMAFSSHLRISKIRCVIHSDDLELYHQATQGLDLLPPVMGGATRQDSVRLGLESFADQNIDHVLIHDAARPFVDHDVINGVLAAISMRVGAIPAVPIADTIKRGQDGKITGTLSRENLFCAQTPQGFKFEEILHAHQNCQDGELTDDAQLFEKMGNSVALTQGSLDNFKITTKDDLMRAERLYAQNTQKFETRTGQGFDAHKFGDGTFVTLGGIKIPHDFGVIGHSDADVALHALTDALLGAIGDGDIGAHFPPTDPQWKGATSDRFVHHAARLIAAKGGRIVNIDITLICESPKIGPYRNDMVTRIAEILNVERERVSVKATTTEGMGFSGRREGIAAQAIANVTMPSG